MSSRAPTERTAFPPRIVSKHRAAKIVDGFFQNDELDEIARRCGVLVQHHVEIESTNDVALEQAPEADGHRLVIAERQTAGRGRGENQWWSTSGSLTFSLLIDAASLNLHVAEWPKASLATGLAVTEAMLASVPGGGFALKWPNDVFLGAGKLAGILVESTPRAAGRLVLGIGVNVNNTFEGAPSEIAEGAVSLRDHTGRSFDRAELLIRVIQTILVRIRGVADNDPSVLERWRELCLLTGRDVRILQNEREVAGRCLGVDDHGALLIEQTDGSREQLFSGVVLSF